MFAGTISQIALAEVCRLLSASNQSGVLNLLSPQEEGHARIFFQAGQIMHAGAGELNGLDALSEICRYTDAAFAFETGVVAPAQTLAAYPTAKLIEKIRQHMDQLQALRVATPDPADILNYNPGASLAGLEATADDLSLLLLCNGSRDVNEVAKVANRSLGDVLKTLARFRAAGILDLQKGASTQTTPVAPAAEGSQSPRYWRGRLVE